jgi:hypothetical protein
VVNGPARFLIFLMVSVSSVRDETVGKLPFIAPGPLLSRLVMCLRAWEIYRAGYTYCGSGRGRWVSCEEMITTRHGEWLSRKNTNGQTSPWETTSNALSI